MAKPVLEIKNMIVRELYVAPEGDEHGSARVVLQNESGTAWLESYIPRELARKLELGMALDLSAAKA
jgi:hypothetical protein